MLRKRMNPKKDRKIYRQTANKGKAVNINRTLYKGGFRF